MRRNISGSPTKAVQTTLLIVRGYCTATVFGRIVSANNVDEDDEDDDDEDDDDDAVILVGVEEPLRPPCFFRLLLFLGLSRLS